MSSKEGLKDDPIEEFVNKFMVKENLKGKKNRILLKSIVKKVGMSETKLKTGYLRATLTKRSNNHEK
jgi:hypothetical protein